MKRSCGDMIDGEKVSKFYFTKVSDKVDTFQCKICPKVQRIQKKGHGYSNLVSHVRQDHPNFEAEMKNTNANLEGRISCWL